MEKPPQNPRTWPFSKPLEFLQKVKYGGAVGKLTAICVAALLVIAVGMVSAWGNETVHLVAFGIIVFLVLVTFWRIAKTLEKHPELALMDGTEIIAYKRVELAAKNHPMLIDSMTIPDPAPPQIEAPREEAE